MVDSRMIDTRRNRLNQILKRIDHPSLCFYAFVAFLTLVFFTGGGSRDDVQSLVILRPLAVLFCAYALTCMRPEHLKGRTFSVYIVFAILLLMLLQLIPLPPSIWVELPSREMFATIANTAGIEQPWRPLTLSPSRTLNSLFSLSVPLAAMLLYLNLSEARRKEAIIVVMGLCLISALLAVFQLAGSSRGPLYLYRITNFGGGVGLFANRNHQAIILASTIVMIGWYVAFLRPTEKLATLKFYGGIATIFVIVPLIFVTGSRAGLLLMAPGLLAAMLFIYFGRYSDEIRRNKVANAKRKAQFISSRNLVLLGSIATVVTTGALSVYFSRSFAFDRLFGGNVIGELRLQLLPILQTMLHDYFPWGSGFGTFEHVYKIYEPKELLNPTYLNQAHNDWLQFSIEGGAPAVSIGLVAAIWFIAQLANLARYWRLSRYTKYTGLMAAIVMLFFLAGSIGDYPLRVPSIITVFLIFACILGDSVRSVKRNAMQDS